jgi:hypothetical protein
MPDFESLIALTDSLVVGVLGDKTVTILRNKVSIATDIDALFERELQDVDSSGLINGVRPGFTLNKADLSVDTLVERDEIVDSVKTWRVIRPLFEDEGMITVLVG